MKDSKPGKKGKINYVFILAAFFAIVIALGVAVSAIIDWDKFKPMIEAKATEALGRKVAIQGKMGGMILPITKVTAENIVIDNIDGGKAPQFLKLQSLDVQVSPFALLGGVIDVNYIKLVRPEIYLEKLSANKNNWDFSAKGAVKGANAKPDAATSSNGAGMANGLQIGSIAIEDGKLIYTDHTNASVQTVESLNMDASLNIAARRAKIDASADWQGQKTKIDLTAKPGDSGMIDAELKAELPQGSLNFAGEISDPSNANGKPVSAIGDFKFAASLKPAAAVSGKLNYNGDNATISGLQLDAGGTVGRGDITVKLQDTPAVDLKLDFDTVDVVKLMAAAASWQTQMAQISGAKAKPASKAQAASASAGLGIKGNANIGIKELVLPNKLAAKDLKIQAATMDGRTVNLQRLAFQSAGDTNIESSGALNYPAMAFNGRVRADIGNLQKLADAMGMGANELIRAQPSRVEFTSGVNYASDKLTLNDYSLRNGDLKSDGTIGYVMGANPNFTVKSKLTHPNIQKLLGKPDLPVDSKLAIDADMAGQIRGGAVAYDALQGRARTELMHGSIKGTDWKKVSERMKELNGIQDILSVLNQTNQQGVTQFESLTADWTVVKGVASTSNLNLDSNVIKASGAGNIQLESKKIDMAAKVNFADHPKVPQLGVTVSGDAAAPKYAFDTNAIAGYYAQRAVNKAIEKNVDTQKLQNKVDKKLGEGGGKLLNKLLGQ